MTTRISATGTKWRVPVRSDHGGELVNVWLSADLQAAVRAYAAEHGITVTAACRLALRQWAGLDDAREFPDSSQIAPKLLTTDNNRRKV